MEYWSSCHREVARLSLMVNCICLSCTNLIDLTHSKAPRQIPLIYSRRLMVTSFFILFDAIYAYLIGNCMDFVIGDCLCFITSINYWRDARYDWRRIIDMMVSMPLFAYHLIISQIQLVQYQKEKIIYLRIALGCFCLYIIGKYAIKSPEIGQIIHSTMHILGAMSNIWIYFYLAQERQKLTF